MEETTQSDVHHKKIKDTQQELEKKLKEMKKEADDLKSSNKVLT